MATKWKNYRYSAFTQWAAAILLLVFSAASLLLHYPVKARKDTYGSYLLPSNRTTQFEETSAFAAEANYLLQQLRAMATDFISDEKMEDGSTWAAIEKTRRAKLEENYSDSYYYYEDAATREAQIQADIESELKSERDDFYSRYYTARDYLLDVRNIKYALVDRSTGRVYTNFAPQERQDEDYYINYIRQGEQWYASYSLQAGFLSGDEYAMEQQKGSTSLRSVSGMHVEAPLSGDTASTNPYLWFKNALSQSRFDIYLASDRSYALTDVFQLAKTAFQQERSASRIQFPALVLCTLISVALAAYVLYATGKQKDSDTITLFWYDHLWGDVFAVGGVIIASFLLSMASNYSYFFLYDNRMYLYDRTEMFVVSVALMLTLLLLSTSLLRRLRAKTLWTNTLAYKLHQKYQGNSEVKRIKREEKAAAKLKRIQNPDNANRWLIALILAFFAAVAAAELAMCLLWEGPAVVVLVFVAIGELVAMLYVLWFAYGLIRLRRATREIQDGNYNVQLNLRRFPRYLRASALSLQDIQAGLKTAIDSAVRDQRMKTELITNVSHDLKTPLTSIISYVDLLKRCDIKDEKASEYIGILDEKSARMKTLVEDLVEASKATSGSIDLNPVSVNLCELTLQAIGEHTDEFTALNIELRFLQPETPVYVYADSQKTWRIVENLFNNARKYAMPHTRVFIDVQAIDGRGIFTMKNISNYPIDVSAEELTQRFVRGDASRSGEGSGLGLSIAKSLSELQGGTFEVSVDGDLFRISFALPQLIVKGPASPSLQEYYQ